MKPNWDKLVNLFEYIGVRSNSYSHSIPEIIYNPEDPIPYYLDQNQRVNYGGPFDDEGIPLLILNGKSWYSFTFIIPYCLGQLAAFYDTGDKKKLNSAKVILDWLIKQQQPDGCWLNPISKSKFGINQPFVSAMTQGLAISVLLRGAELLNSEEYKNAAIAALNPFLKDISQGGVTTIYENYKFFEEYPFKIPHHVLNGFFFALWGLYDLVRFEKNEIAKELWEDGLTTIKKWLPKYDCGYWSLYHIPAKPPNPATVTYHNLHIKQLEVMYAITNEEIFREYSIRWQKYSHGRFNALRSLPLKLRWLISS